MQPVQTVFTETYAVEDDRADIVDVTITRVRGGGITGITVVHRQTVSSSPSSSNGETVNGRRIRSQHAP